MTSKDDDTLPLPGFSQELSVDTTVDEDFIPSSQPQSSGSLKVPVTNLIKSTKELKCGGTSDSKVDDTLLVTEQSSVDWDKSEDFIPETETKKVTINYAIENLPCKKKLSVFDPEDIFKVQSNPVKWDSDISKIPESPVLDTQNFSVLNDSPVETSASNQETVKKCEESVAEIIVNDSSDTVDLEATPVKTESPDPGRGCVEKLEISSSVNTDGEKCEETQVFDNSSILLLDQPGTSSLVLEKSELGDVASEKSYLQKAVDESKADSQEKAPGFGLRGDSIPPAAELSDKSTPAEEPPDVPKLPSKTVEVCPSAMESSGSSTAVRQIDFKLTVNCVVFINTKTNKVMKKIISKVCETPKPKPVFKAHVGDNASDKFKRYSTSSSGSVYSDQTGLPLPLPKRVSNISDVTDSSEEDFYSTPKQARRALERLPWKNEYLLPLKMDDIMQVLIDNEELLKRPVVSPRKPVRVREGGSHLKGIFEGSALESKTLPTSGSGELQSTTTTTEVLEKDSSENSETLLSNEVNKQGDKLKEMVQNQTDDKASVGGSRKEEEAPVEPAAQSEQSESDRGTKPVEEQTALEEETSSISLREGLPVFARWSDKRYYPGVLNGNVKNDRWEVKFDDGTLKAVRKDFIMPSEWLTLGALVFVLTDDRYESGQIVDMKRGEELNYLVELDTQKKVVSVKISDLCLTDVLATIVREKYKPLMGTPRGTADIDFDNVVSGKRIREQRTPSGPSDTLQEEHSGGKKKSLTKAKKTTTTGSLESIKETPPTKDLRDTGALKPENCPPKETTKSGYEAGGTPLRGTPRKRKGKAKPRSLSYEAEETYTKRKVTSKSWVTPDGTPIPGPSGVKFKKQKANPKTRGPERPPVKSVKSPTVLTRSSKKNPARFKASLPIEKSRRKRKLDESSEETVTKKSFKEGDARNKTRIKKG